LDQLPPLESDVAARLFADASAADDGRSEVDR
jgi:hypothetical protein